MKTTLPHDWFTNRWIDAEYQQYVILAYLQAVQTNFAADKLFPDLPDLRAHCTTGQTFRQGKGALRAQFPKRIDRISWRPPRVEYVAQEPDDRYLTELDAIMDFALPRFEAQAAEGEARWQELATLLKLEPIGLLPLRFQEGYLLLHQTARADTAIYAFRLTLYDNDAPGGRRVYLEPLDTVRRGPATTFEALKLALIRRYSHLPNPATFALESPRPLPEEETLLPLARQLLARAVA